ncbi:hypothetical protein P154DRAFT_86277 [Amniculicola lignicola CBS 123094]|uniref:Zn(2)-C6 fungal-type domain-containing protein n=1 Tax=Amniculicola lignicola CBS 123094 TaxID=1392246 RepID=A0A6A5WTA4_9PLEO|nr:hypothetical protein P154DRAFT_86277 [Amniculicola lignicola CBS 123094]
MLRRNGKPRSCEPCRISKIRCGHETPKCHKCQARGMEEQCFYHPAPMTKPPGTPRKQSEPRRRVVRPRYSEQADTRGHGDHAPIDGNLDTTHQTQAPLGGLLDTIQRSSESDIRSTITNPHSSSIVWPTPPDSMSIGVQRSPEASRSYYLGSTSYASVFAEEQPIPDSLHEQSIQRADETPPALSNAYGSRHCHIGVGRSIISKLYPFSLFERSVELYFELNKACAIVGPLVTLAMPQLRIDLERLTQTASNPYASYVEITRNTIRPLKVPSSMLASEFHTLFTGQNLRWETLGLILILAGSNAQFTPPDHPLFLLSNGQRINKEDFIEDMIHTSNACINLCQIHGAVNDIMVWLIYMNMLVTSNFYGDNYHGVWRGMGATTSALYAEGIHCENKGFEEPFFLREARRRIYIAVYRSDKTLATFFGRPPMMNGHYTDRKLPLDLDDNVITTSDPQVLADTLAKLDSEGWNTDGKLTSSSWPRVRFQLSKLKERMLEQSLAGEADVDIVDKLKDLCSDLRRTWEALPGHLRYDLYNEDLVWMDLGHSMTLRMIAVYLEYLHMDFQLQRLMRRESQLAVPGLLEISMRLTNTVLVFNKQRNQAYEIMRHFPTIILFYCLPSAGVLALELRRCTLENVPLPGTVSRADIIRNLSVLISCLEWAILPGDGNHNLCNELNKMLALVLDEVLNYQPQANRSQDGGTTDGLGGPGAGFFDLPMIDGMEPIPTESEDFLIWLDNANWSSTTVSFL